MSRRWFVGTPLPNPLAEEGHVTVALLRSEADRRQKAEAAFAFVYAVGEESLRYHFRQPLAALGVGIVMRRALDVALDLALKGIRRSMRTVLMGMDDAQLRGVADEIEVRLYPDPHG